TATEVRSYVFLQGNGEFGITDSARHRPIRNRQGRQSTLAAKLLSHPGKYGRRRYLKSLLSGERSWNGAGIRKRAHRNWGNCCRQSLSRIRRPEVHNQRSEA